MADSAPLPQQWFQRLDNGADAEFYREPRFVQHIDEATIAALTAYYASLLFEQARVLDLMSSWVSHLPAAPALAKVSGLGMNAAELANNPRLDDYRVQDLNLQPGLPFADGEFDFVFIAVSVQYLINPLPLFSDIARVLSPGGCLVVAMSHRCFPSKAIRAFHGADGAARMALVKQYCVHAAAFSDIESIDRSPPNVDPLWLVTARTAPRS